MLEGSKQPVIELLPFLLATIGRNRLQSENMRQDFRRRVEATRLDVEATVGFKKKPGQQSEVAIVRGGRLG